jgi:hypothetical protein
MKFKPGQLIKWTEEYDDFITKDAGVGIVMSVNTYSHMEANYINYTVYRNKHNDKMFFDEKNIQILKGE